MVSRTGEHIPRFHFINRLFVFHLGGPHRFFFIFPKKIYTLLILFLISFFRLSLMREKQLASPLPHSHLPPSFYT